MTWQQVPTQVKVVLDLTIDAVNFSLIVLETFCSLILQEMTQLKYLKLL